MTARIVTATALVIAATGLTTWDAACALAPTTTPPETTAAVPLARHDVGQSYMFLRVYDDSLVVTLEITSAHLGEALGFGWNPEALPSLPQIEERLQEILAYVEPRFELSAAGTPFTPDFRGIDLMEVPDLGDFVKLEYLIEGLDGIPDVIDVLYSVIFEVDSQHRNFLVIEHNWKTATFNNEANFSLIFSPRNPQQSLDLTSSSNWRGFVGLIWLGVLHIWIGIDHLMFLLALVLPAVLMRREGRWEPVPGFKQAFWNIVKIVTFFTLAHSVTLSLAGLDVIRISSRLVESIIAASIAFAAAANLVPRVNVREWAIAFGFGLFHGFGFATVLGAIGVGRDHLALTLFGFNLGVELGQLAVILVVFPVLYLLRAKAIYSWLLRLGSCLLIAISLIWFTERALGLEWPLIGTALGILSWIAGLFTGSP